MDHRVLLTRIGVEHFWLEFGEVIATMPLAVRAVISLPSASQRHSIVIDTPGASDASPMAANPAILNIT